MYWSKNQPYGGAVEYRAVRELGMRQRVLVRRGAWVDEQLQRQRQARVARQDGVHGRQRAARAVTAHGQAVGSTQPGGVGGQPGERVPGVVAGGGKGVLGRQAVIERQHHYSGPGAPARGTAHHALATLPMVKPPPCRYSSAGSAAAVPGAYSARAAARHHGWGHADPPTRRQLGPGHLQHAGTSLVGDARLGRAQGIQCRPTGACQRSTTLRICGVSRAWVCGHEVGVRHCLKCTCGLCAGQTDITGRDAQAGRGGSSGEKLPRLIRSPGCSVMPSAGQRLRDPDHGIERLARMSLTLAAGQQLALVVGELHLHALQRIEQRIALAARRGHGNRLACHAQTRATLMAATPGPLSCAAPAPPGRAAR